MIMKAVTATIGITTAMATVPDVLNPPPPDLEATFVALEPAVVEEERLVCWLLGTELDVMMMVVG
jgi:hypothetical protein